MSSRINEVLTRLNKENKLVVEIKDNTTIIFTHRDSGTLLWKMENVAYAQELFEAWSK